MIGNVGRTAYGKCGTYFCDDPPHLHFEVIPGEGGINPRLQRSDPLAWLSSQGVRPAVA